MRIIVKPGGLAVLTGLFGILMVVLGINFVHWNVPARKGTVLLQENFARYKPGARPNGWKTSMSDQWRIVADPAQPKERAYSQSSSKLDPRAITGDPAWKDYSLYVDVRADSFPKPGGLAILVRASDNNNFYQLELNTNDGPHWAIHCCKNNNFIPLASGTFNWMAQKWYTLQLSVRGSRITAHISEDGGNTWKLLGSVIDSTLPRGKIGIKTWQATGRFTHIRVVQE